jgi:hypothetical protein
MEDRHSSTPDTPLIYQVAEPSLKLLKDGMLRTQSSTRQPTRSLQVDSSFGAFSEPAHCTSPEAK